MLDKIHIANSLREIAAFLRVKGEPSYRVRAYERGAGAVDAVADLERLVAEQRLTDLPGIGPSLAGVIRELHQTGHSRLLDRLHQEIPAAVVALAQVPGISRKKAEQIHRELGVSTSGDLMAACDAGRLRELHGMGPKTEARIRSAIQRFEDRQETLVLTAAEELARTLLAHVEACPDVIQGEIAGALRRWHETVDSIELVATSRDPAQARAHFARHPLVVRAVPSMNQDADACAVKLSSGITATLYAVEPERAGAVMLRATGSAAHAQALDRLAAQRGLSLAALRGRSEAEVYEQLGLPYIPPELREGEGEIATAQAGRMPLDLVTAGDVCGALHCHTVYSDGKHTIEEMARAAEALGYSYLTITDHSPTAHYAGGVTLDRLEAQWDEIARVQERVNIRLLRGAESDILADGSLDYPVEILEQLDVVIASVHSRLGMDEDAMTRRLVAAMRQPVFKIWGHPLGRLIQRRDPCVCRVDEVLDAAAENRVAIEINGDPRRLDLPPTWVRKARERGIPFVLSSDAHSTRGLANVRYAAAMARRGWLRRGDVLNTLPAPDFAQVVSPACAASRAVLTH
ncbi:MAG TPA: helix-hairpin-helix domain-containing protein [Haliangium sp.]|nr:helix-hairpin-helix domain-containing protein [Haliangium sp.]